MMKPKDFVGQLDDARILKAIAEAERRSTGEIRLYVSERAREDALAAARTRFAALGMTKTRQRNAILLYFAPRTQQFAIWGDEGIHEKCGEIFWTEVTASMTPLLKEGRYTEAIVLAVERVGELLARHFPPGDGDINELPDEVVRD